MKIRSYKINHFPFPCDYCHEVIKSTDGIVTHQEEDPKTHQWQPELHFHRICHLLYMIPPTFINPEHNERSIWF